MIEEWLIEPLFSLVWRSDRQGRGQIREPQTGPRPIHRVFDESCASWIAEHIAQDREEMAVPLKGKTLETCLPGMSTAAVVLIIAADMTRPPPLHERTQARLRDGATMYGKVDILLYC